MNCLAKAEGLLEVSNLGEIHHVHHFWPSAADVAEYQVLMCREGFSAKCASPGTRAKHHARPPRADFDYPRGIVFYFT